jgi:hypothetical protein
VGGRRGAGWLAGWLARMVGGNKERRRGKERNLNKQKPKEDPTNPIKKTRKRRKTQKSEEKPTIKTLQKPTP